MAVEISYLIARTIDREAKIHDGHKEYLLFFQIDKFTSR